VRAYLADEAGGCPAGDHEAPLRKPARQLGRLRRATCRKEKRMTITKDNGIRLHSTLILWVLASLAGWILFNCLIATIQTASYAFRFGLGSEEIYTPLEALMYRVVGILFYDSKLIILTVLLWGLLFKITRKFNNTWKHMVLSISATYIIVIFAFILLSRTKLSMAIFTSVGTSIYIALLAPRLLFKKLRPGNIHVP
jgi:hypothetical protein